MELSFGFLLSLSATLVSIIFLLHKKINNNNRNKRKLPPGNMALPWIGETPAFYKAQVKNRLFEDFIQPRIARHGNVFKTMLMGSPTVVVSGVAANRFFLSNEFKLVVSAWPSTSVQLMGKESIMETIGERHRCVRGVITEVLSPSGLEHLVPKICKTVEEHLKTHWQGRDRIILFRSAKMLTFSIVMECLLGIEVEPGMLDMFERVLEGVFKPLVELPGTPFWRAKRARLGIVEMLLSVVRKKREEMERGLGEKEEGSLLTRLVKGLIQGEISEVEVIDNMVLLVFASHDTTSFAIAMTCRMLAHHPNCYALLLQEHVKIMESKRPGETLTLEDTKKMNYTWQVARESLRMFPPIFGSFRKAIVDIQYEGFTIPKGWKVLWTAYGTHYDKDYFPDPLSFNPSRFEEPIPPYAFIPFGGGPRTCAGYQLAKLNILLFLHFFVTRYDWSLIHPDETITMDPLPFPRHGMPIKISPKF
ncbi:taxadiene 5-alpha hydroxylase [Telopea speciosissima]|uniref:taxadiene 5-alpha hydroxylase n=1 Tax=Telopea speciosissima TaxID=54955 RepID=UPI001CC53B5F|nr:taxadiene 5-alpha hydroxylase [Telopea speciosissima]